MRCGGDPLANFHGVEAVRKIICGTLQGYVYRLTSYETPFKTRSPGTQTCFEHAVLAISIVSTSFYEIRYSGGASLLERASVHELRCTLEAGECLVEDGFS